MKIEFIGVGSAFSKVEYSSNLLMREQQKSMVIDFGSTACKSLFEKQFDLKKIEVIFITHLHADHISGLEELALLFKLIYKKKPLLVSTPTLLKSLWGHSLRGGLEYIEATPGDGTALKLEDYFTLFPIRSNKKTSLPINIDFSFKFVPNNHILNMESYGIVGYCKRGHSFFFSGDTRCEPDYVQKHGENADLIFHDCQIENKGPKNVCGVHASLDQLKELPVYLREKMWLYHHVNGVDIPDITGLFAGFASRNDTFAL